MRRIKWAVGGLVVGLLVGQIAARADSIAPISRKSTVFAETKSKPLMDPVGTYSSDSDEISHREPYDRTVTAGRATAHQQSEILSNGAQVSMQVAGPKQGTEFGFNNATSRFDAVFGVSSEGVYRLFGSLQLNSVVPLPPGQYGADVTLKGPGVDLLVAGSNTERTKSYDLTGELAPGIYTLSTRAWAQEYWGASAQISAELLVVPEPSGAWVVGLLGLLAIRWRRPGQMA